MTPKKIIDEVRKVRKLLRQVLTECVYGKKETDIPKKELVAYLEKAQSLITNLAIEIGVEQEEAVLEEGTEEEITEDEMTEDELEDEGRI